MRGIDEVNGAKDRNAKICPAGLENLAALVSFVCNEQHPISKHWKDLNSDQPNKTCADVESYILVHIQQF